MEKALFRSIEAQVDDVAARLSHLASATKRLGCSPLTAAHSDLGLGWLR
jgi:hypothetical protein